MVLSSLAEDVNFLGVYSMKGNTKDNDKERQKLSGLSNHCSCVREGSLGTGRNEDHPAREHLRTLQMIPNHHQVSISKKEENTVPKNFC